jgi:hypothetical protein
MSVELWEVQEALRATTNQNESARKSNIQHSKFRTRTLQDRWLYSCLGGGVKWKNSAWH